MKVGTLLTAISEAERFISFARQVKTHTLLSPVSRKEWEVVEEYTKESAACKRASLDLTRVLAQLRQDK